MLHAVLSCFSRVQLLETPWTIAHQAYPSMGNPKQEYIGSGCHFFLQGIFPTQGLNPHLLHCRWILYCLSHQGRPVTSCAEHKF